MGSPLPVALAFEKDAGSVAFLVKAYVEARQKSHEWEVTAAGYAVALEKNMDQAKVANFEVDGITVTRVQDGLSSRLDKQRLMKLGVSGDVIAAATVETKRKGYVRVETPETKMRRQATLGGMVPE